MDSHDALRKSILDELAREAPNGQYSEEQLRAVALGRFIEACLQQVHLSRHEFAVRLDMEDELAEAIIEGILPVSELDEDLLQHISLIIGCDPILLKQFIAI